MQYINSSNVDTYSKYIQSGDLTPDKFLMFQDPSANELTKMKRLQTLQEKTYTTDGEKTEMTQLLEDLREFMPTSEDWNKLCCGIYSVQVFLRDGIVMFVQQKKDEFNEIVNNFKHIGDYDSTYKYKKGNMVTFEGEGYTCKKDCVGIEPNPLKTTEYWTKYTIKGDKGDPSLNIYYRGEYDATRTYNLKNGDACTVDGTLYYAKADNIVGLYPPYYADSWANFANSAIYINTVLPSVGTRNKGTLYFLQTDSNNLEKGILQDYLGNIIKPQTDASNVIYGDSTVKDTLDILTSNQTNYSKTTNSGNNYSVTIPNLTDLTDGYSLMVKFNATSTGAITLNPNNKGLINVVDYYGNPINDVRNNLIANLVYEKSSNSFILLGKGGDGDVLSSEMLINKTATTKKGKVVGTMANNGAINANLNAGQAKVIPKGYTDGGTITANSLASQTQANAGAGDILSGRNAWVNANLVTGNIPTLTGIRNATGVSRWGDNGLAVYPERGYQKGGSGDGEIKVSQSQLINTYGINANKIVSGQEIAGVWGSATTANIRIGTATPRIVIERYSSSSYGYYYIDLDFVPDLVITKDRDIGSGGISMSVSSNLAPTSYTSFSQEGYHSGAGGYRDEITVQNWTPSSSILVYRAYSTSKDANFTYSGSGVQYTAIKL